MYRAQYEVQCWYSFRGYQHGSHEVTQTSVVFFRNVIGYPLSTCKHSFGLLLLLFTVYSYTSYGLNSACRVFIHYCLFMSRLIMGKFLVHLRCSTDISNPCQGHFLLYQVLPRVLAILFLLLNKQVIQWDSQVICIFLGLLHLP